jgi:molybdopterin converting factor subunit 1
VHSHKKEKAIEVLYFASLREQRGKEREQLFTKCHGVAELYDELALMHGFHLKRDFVRAAINDTFVPWQEEIRSGDKIVFVPPVSGG